MQTDNGLLPRFYPGNNAISVTEPRKEDLHDLALLFAILAVGCVNEFNLPLPQRKADAEMYAHLSRAALVLRGVFEYANLFPVQAIFVLGTYAKVRGEGQSEAACNLLSFGSQIAISVSYV